MIALERLRHLAEIRRAIEREAQHFDEARNRFGRAFADGEPRVDEATVTTELERGQAHALELRERVALSGLPLPMIARFTDVIAGLERVRAAWWTLATDDGTGDPFERARERWASSAEHQALLECARYTDFDLVPIEETIAAGACAWRERDEARVRSGSRCHSRYHAPECMGGHYGCDDDD
jgi:hypothetical protein